MFKKVDVYEYKLFTFIDAYKRLLDRVINASDFMMINMIKGCQFILFQSIEILRATGKVMRYSTIPIHWLWIWWEMKHGKEYSDIQDMPWFQIGAHYIYGKPGSGKSTFTYHAMMDYAYHSGKCSYTTAMMELPRKNIDGREYYYHQLFNPSDIFAEGKQFAGFENDRFNFVVYEEMLTQYQQRNNSKSSYKDEFLPLVAAMGTQRHQSIDLFYFISQLPRNDIALMQILTGYHVPKIKKGLDYKLWLDTGKIRFKIMGWEITSYDIELSNSNGYDLINKRKSYYKNIYPEDMAYFNRLNMKDKFKELKKMKGTVMSA